MYVCLYIYALKYARLLPHSHGHFSNSVPTDTYHICETLFRELQSVLQNCELFCGESYTEDTSCLKLVSGNRSLLNSFLLINTHKRFEILTAVKITMLLCVVMMRRNIDRFRRFEEAYHRHLHRWIWQHFQGNYFYKVFGNRSAYFPVTTGGQQSSHVTLLLQPI
jgi:hypothetical protein